MDVSEYRERSGKIRTADLFRVSPWSRDTAFDGLTEYELRILREGWEGPVPDPLPELDLAGFLAACSVVYDVCAFESARYVNWFHWLGYEPYPRGLDDVGRYRRYADGRDAGMLDLPLHDPDAFLAWKNRRELGHPFEVKAGYKSLLVPVHDESGWTLYCGSTCAAELNPAVHAWLSLMVGRGLPAKLWDEDRVRKFARGESWVGIVPQDDSRAMFMPAYWPEDDVDYWTALPSDPDEARSWIECVEWDDE